MANQKSLHVVTNTNDGWNIKKGDADRCRKHIDNELNFPKEINVRDFFSF